MIRNLLGCLLKLDWWEIGSVLRKAILIRTQVLKMRLPIYQDSLNNK